MKYFATTLILCVLAACKPMHRQDSDASYLNTDSGIVLSAEQNQTTGGICIMQTVPQNSHHSSFLLTEGGSITENQLKEALRFSSYQRQLAAIVIPVLAAGGIVMLGSSRLKRALYSLSDDIVAIHPNPNVPGKNLLEINENVVEMGMRPSEAKSRNYINEFYKQYNYSGAAAVITIAGGAAFQVETGIEEGETAGNTVLKSFVHWLSAGLLAPIHESWIRIKRLGSVLDSEKSVNITDKKMRKMAERIRKLTPTFKGGCDHLK